MSRQQPPPTGQDTPEQDPVRLCADQGRVADPSAEWGLSLLREATPYQSPAGRKERVWLALPRVRLYRPARLRFALAASALLVSGAFASAALAGWPPWLTAVIESIVPSAPHPTPTAPAKRLHQAPSERPRAPVLLPLPVSGPVAAPQIPTSEETASSARPKRASRPASPEDMGPLLEAMRALRVERNPLRARALLTAYLDRHPNGKLSEEALVMLIEAAAGNGDSDAQALAARYLKLYPRGPFRGMVERMLAAIGKGP
jgi:hypothetical protein